MKRAKNLNLKETRGVVTFRRPLTFAEYEELIQKAGIKVSSFKVRAKKSTGETYIIRGRPEEQGFFPRQKIKRWIQPKTKKIGVTSLKGTIQLKNYCSMSESKLIALVDISPLVIKQKARKKYPTYEFKGTNLQDAYGIIERITDSNNKTKTTISPEKPSSTNGMMFSKKLGISTNELKACPNLFYYSKCKRKGKPLDTLYKD